MSYKILSLVLTSLFIGLAIDVGRMAYMRRQGRAITESAALSAASAIPTYNQNGDASKLEAMFATSSSSKTAIKQGADRQFSDIEFILHEKQSNSIAPATSYQTANGIRLTKIFDTPLFFGRLFGVPSMATYVRAVAILDSIGGAAPNLPLALMGCKVAYPGNCGAPKTLVGFNQSPSPEEDSAFTSYFFMDNTSANVFKGMMNGSIPIPFVKVGNQIELNNGEMASTLQAMEGKCKEVQCSDSKPWCVLLPVISCDGLKSGHPIQRAQIIGFATMCIVNIEAQGNPKTITASLQCGVMAEGASGGGMNFGSYAAAPVLVR
ncbi:MAG: pilus assembly protein TadG-related protein [Candidatus Binatia bacterium]